MLADHTVTPNDITTLHPHVLATIILIEGFVSIATEILVIRQLLPVAGGSVIVTSLVIGFFLLFLALGYQAGGRVLERPIQHLRRNFLLAAAWLGVGCSYVFVTLFFFYFHRYFSFHVIYPLLCYLLIVIAPLIYLLGQTLPITMNFLQQQRVAAMGGYILSLSTIGSFLGSIVTSLVLLHYAGVAQTVCFNVLLLLLLHCALADNLHRCYKAFTTSFLFALVIVIVNIGAEKMLFTLTDSYANYQIVSDLDQDQRIAKTLVINEALSSKLDAQGRGFQYIETIKRLVFDDLHLRHQSMLVLGAGGFSLTATGTHDNQVTYVDVDPAIKQVAVPRFVAEMKSAFVADDARHFLSVSDQKYAVIINDVYTDYKAIPAHLLTVEYVRLIKNHLTADGTAIFNMVANPMLTDRYSKHIDNTLRSVFRSCMALPQAYVNRASNIIYLCSQRGLKDHGVYRDNLNHSTTDSFSW